MNLMEKQSVQEEGAEERVKKLEEQIYELEKQVRPLRELGLDEGEGCVGQEGQGGVRAEGRTFGAADQGGERTVAGVA